jgi:hypothetical protein
MPPAPRDGFSVLKIFDTFVQVPSWEGGGGKQMNWRPCTARVEAESLVEEWAHRRMGATY